MRCIRDVAKCGSMRPVVTIAPAFTIGLNGRLRSSTTMALNGLPDGSTPTRSSTCVASAVLEGHAEHERLGDRLDREVEAGVAHLVDVAVGGDDGDAEPRRVGPPQLRDVGRHLPLVERRVLLQQVTEMFEDGRALHEHRSHPHVRSGLLLPRVDRMTPHSPAHDGDSPPTSLDTPRRRPGPVPTLGRDDGDCTVQRRRHRLGLGPSSSSRTSNATAKAYAIRLRSEGYRSRSPVTARRRPGCASASSRPRRARPHAPGLDGIEVCKQIQREHPLPVLMLTARDSETDLLVGLAVGADDYMTKPFSARELVAGSTPCCARRARRAPATGPR